MNNGQNENFHLKTMTLKIIVPILLAVTVLITSSGLLISKYLLRSNEPTLGSNIDSSSDDTYEPEVPVIYDKSIPASLKGVSVVPGVDFLTSGEGFDEAASQAKALIDSAKADKFNALNLTVNYNGGLICGGDFAVSGYADLLSYIHGYIKSNGMELAVTLDLGALAADVEHIEIRQKLRVETHGVELYLALDAVGIDDLAHGDKFYTHKLSPLRYLFLIK